MRNSSLIITLLLVLVAAGCSGGSAPFKHVIIISMDTTRADHLGCYGNQTVKTPNLDRIAAESVIFTDAMATAPTTLASHMSMMTGSYPHTHGVAANGYTIHPDNEMLAETLKEQGFSTAAFLGSFALGREFGFNAGFEVYDDQFDLLANIKDFDQDQRRAKEVTDAALEYVDGVSGDDPLFLFVHYFDAHSPFDPPAPYNEMYGSEAGLRAATLARVGDAQVAHRVRNGDTREPSMVLIGLTREMIEQAPGTPFGYDEDMAALYAGEVTYMDVHIGRLIDGLAVKGILDDALLIVTADHGETFWEHADAWNHGLFLYDTTVHVPMIVRLPPAAAATGEVSVPVSTVDIVPTVLDFLGIATGERVEGVSLVPALRGEDLERGPCVQRSDAALARAHAATSLAEHGQPALHS